jgi:hypothetical protein
MAAVARVQLSPLCVAAKSVVMDPPRVRQAEEIERDLFGKPIPPIGSCPEGMLFRIMLAAPIGKIKTERIKTTAGFARP